MYTLNDLNLIFFLIFNLFWGFDVTYNYIVYCYRRILTAFSFLLT